MERLVAVLLTASCIWLSLHARQISQNGREEEKNLIYVPVLFDDIATAVVFRWFFSAFNFFRSTVFADLQQKNIIYDCFMSYLFIRIRKKNTTKKMIHRKEWSKRRRRKTHGISHTFTLRDRNNDRLELRIFSSLWKNENRGANFFWRALRVLCTLLVHETLIHHASAQSYRLVEKATELWIFINRRSSLLSVSVPTFIYVLLGFFARALIKCILLSFPLFISP